MELNARIINFGKVKGIAIVSKQPISFFGCVDIETGRIIEKNHELYGKSIKNKILVFPYGKGSTVGSYALYRLKKNKVAPKGIINKECEPIVAIGAIISDIACVDKVDIRKIETGDYVIINGGKVIIEKKKCKKF
ncbi:MAG: DUF126 domain-containing protein [Candidatus Altiarchaeota archaeon]